MDLGSVMLVLSRYKFSVGVQLNVVFIPAQSTGGCLNFCMCHVPSQVIDWVGGGVNTHRQHTQITLKRDC